MAFVITCPSCGLQGHVPDGVTVPPQVNCPRCSTPVNVPAASSAPSGEPRKQPLDEFFARAFEPTGPAPTVRMAAPPPASGSPVSPGAVAPSPAPAPAT